MLYLDTSAVLKLYLEEEGTPEVVDLVAGQSEPLPVWFLTEVEFTNAVRFKVFTAELKESEVEDLLARYHEHKAEGRFFTPALDPVILQELSLRMTSRTPRLGCRALDLLHVAAARLCEADLFVTSDECQSKLAEAEGLTVRLVG
jgi:predicted nucleic acid-binding protein